MPTFDHNHSSIQPSNCLPNCNKMKNPLVHTAALTTGMYLLRYVMYTKAENNTDNGIPICGAPPCQTGCYYNTNKADSNEVGLCTMVPIGHYSPGDAKLYPCPKGTYASEIGSPICIVCPTGTSAPRDESGSCTPCDEGLYAAQTGLAECEKCNPGKYFGRASTGIIRENNIDFCSDPSDDPLECGNSTSPCSGRCYIVGNISMKTDFMTRSCAIVPKGFYSPHGDELIYACPIGMYSLEGSNECTLCAPGSVANTSGSGSCQHCPKSTYSSGFGSTSCSYCNSSLYSGIGSFSIFRDDGLNISYCLKPIQETMGNLSSVPTHIASLSPSQSLTSLSPSQSLTSEPINPSVQPSTTPSVTVEITVHPTSIFDVITVSTQSPEAIIGDLPPSVSIDTAFNDTSAAEKSRGTPIGTRLILLLVLFVISALVYWIHRYWQRYRIRRHRELRQEHEEEIMRYRRRQKVFARTPPVDVDNIPDDIHDDATTLSPTFSVPKEISTTKIANNYDQDEEDDDDSEVGVYIEDGSVM